MFSHHSSLVSALRRVSRAALLNLGLALCTLTWSTAAHTEPFAYITNAGSDTVSVVGADRAGSGDEAISQRPRTQAKPGYEREVEVTKSESGRRLTAAVDMRSVGKLPCVRCGYRRHITAISRASRSLFSSPQPRLFD